VDTIVKLKLIDLFSGCGGFSTGFDLTGLYSVVAGNDIDEDCMAAFKLNHPKAKCWPGSITDLDAKMLMRDVGLMRGELDVLIGGPPCQGFSRNRANRHKHGRFVDDPRNYLFREFLRFVEAFLPRAILIENVADMISKEQGRFLSDIAVSLNDLGYTYIQSALMNAADYGVPQRRRRAIVLASRETSLSIPLPTYSNLDNQEMLIPLDPWRTIEDAIADLPSLREGAGESPCKYATEPLNSYQKFLRNGATTVRDHVAWKLSKVQSDRLKMLKPGEGVESLSPDLTPKSTYGSAYRRMSWDIPALTITTWMYHPGSGMFFHPSDHRTITLREGARLQSFPDDTQFVGGKISRCRQVGNAVPPLLGSALAHQLYASLG